MYRHEQELADALSNIAKAVLVVEKHLARAGLSYSKFTTLRQSEHFSIVLPTQFPALRVVFGMTLLPVYTDDDHYRPGLQVMGDIEDNDGSFVKGLDALGAHASEVFGGGHHFELTERDDPEHPRNFPRFVLRVLDYLFPVTGDQDVPPA